jgi:hypothetical protein
VVRVCDRVIDHGQGLARSRRSVKRADHTYPFESGWPIWQTSVRQENAR